MKRSGIYLAEDLLVEILLRLPVKFLLRFRCVCKLWCRIISSTSFINAQKHVTPNTNIPYLCKHSGFYSLVGEDELNNHKIYYYAPDLFGIYSTIKSIKVYGNCKGLLCVSDLYLRVDSIIYLLNPIIRKIKRIPSTKIHEQIGGVDLCLGHFDGDYKLIKIAASTRGYYVGVYSLRTNCWKVKNCDHDDDSNVRSFHAKVARFVNGVAYFVKRSGGIICFGLYDEMIREVKFPETFNGLGIDNSFAIEAYGESIALMETSSKIWVVWVLQVCSITKKYTWEKMITIDFRRKAFDIYPIGFVNNSTYMLKDRAKSRDRGRKMTGYYYLYNLESSEFNSYRSEGKPPLWSIDTFVENLVLLNEENIDPFVEFEPCSTHTTFMLNMSYKRITAMKDGKKEMINKRRNKLQHGRNTKRKI